MASLSHPSFVFFVQEAQGVNLLSSFSRLYDRLSFNPSLVKKNLLPSSKIFDDILKCEVDPIQIRRLVLAEKKPYPQLGLTKDELSKFYLTITDDETRKFIEYVFVAPFDYYKSKLNELKKIGTFGEEALGQFIRENPRPNVSSLFGKYSLFAYLTNPLIIDNLYTPLKLDGVESIDMFETTIDLLTHFAQTTGGKKSLNFEDSLRFVKRIAPIWDSLKMASSNQDPEENDFAVDDPSNHVPTPDEIASIYAGNYSLVPSNYEKAKGFAYGLVANSINFNSLSKDRKLQVSNYLLNNKQAFNANLSNACITIANEIERCMDSNIKLAKGLLNDSVSKQLNRCSNSLFSAYESVRGASTANKLNFIIRAFIPLTNAFASRISAEFGHDEANNIYSKLNSANLNIFSSSNSSDFIGGDIAPKPEVKYVTKIVEKPVYIQAPKSPYDFLKGGDEPFVSGIHVEKAENIIRKMVETQRQFNNSFASVYRKLISDINTINFGDIYKDRLNTYYAIPTILNSITINNPKSTIYISGLYGKHNYNSIYSEVLAAASEELRKLNIPQVAKIIDDITSLHGIVAAVGEKANDLTSRFATAKDATPEILINGAKQIKIRSDLSSKDFNDMNEAIQRLFWKLNSTSSESDIRNHRDDLKAYIEKSKNREKLIEEHFARKDQDLIFDVREIRPSATYRNDYIQAKRAIYSQQLALFKYINNVFDIAFTKQKLAEISQKVLSPAQIKKLEDTFLLFKKSKVSGRFYEDFNKLINELSKNSSMFTLAKHLKKIISHSHYIEFIETLYRELEIFDKSFNWKEFKENILNFLAINSFDIDFVYQFKFRDESAPLFNNVFKLDSNNSMLSSFERALLTILSHNSNTSHILELFNSLTSIFSDARRNKIIPAKFINIQDENHILNIKRNNLSNDWGLDLEVDSQIFEILHFKYLGISNITAIKISQGDFTIVAKDGDDNFIEQLKLDSEDDVKGVEAFVKFGNSTNSEDKLLEFVFDSLISNVVLVVDKYWKLKYHGAASLPTNVEQALRGGAMPGSIFDVKTLHDYTNSEVIPEAVPFYICALNCSQYYIHHAEYNKYHEEMVSSLNAISGKRHVRVSKISSIYPLINLFSDEDDGYNAKVSELTIQQLNTAIGVLNVIWNRTNGSNTRKLSAAIDIFLSELNTCIYITDDAHETLLMNEYKVTNELEHAMFDKLDESLKLMQAAIKSAHMDTYTWKNPEIAQIKFESILKKAMEDIKDKDPESRMSELRNILHNSNKDADAEFSEYFRFMDGVFAPIITTYRSYSAIFNLFYYYRRHYKSNNGNRVISINLKDWQYWDRNNELKNLWDDLLSKGCSKVQGLAYLGDTYPVEAWNNILYHKMLFKYLKTGEMRDPIFWNLLDLNSYPKVESISCEIPENLYYSHFLNVEPLRQIWPNLRARSIGDYFEVMLKEYANDIDEALHLFMSYPGIGLETIRTIERDCHDNITFKSLMNRSFIKETLNDLRNIEIRKQDTLTLPNWTENTITIPEFVAANGRAVPPVEFSFGLDNLIEGTNLSLNQRSNLPAKKPISLNNLNANNFKENVSRNISFYPDYDSIRNGFLDRVLFVLASCNPIDFTVPYKLAQLISTNPVLLKISKPILLSNDSAITYDKNLNPITQNIMGRSLSELNQNKEYFDFTPQTIASLLSIIPYLINYLQTANFAYTSGASYRGTLILDEANSLINALTQFYAELSPYAQPLGFLQKNAFNISNDHDHPMGELVHYTSVDLTDINNVVAMEWANKFAFSNLKNIAFPDFKNRDKFEWWKNFEEDKLRNPAFAKNSQIILENNARLVWAAMIANSTNISKGRPSTMIPDLQTIHSRVRVALLAFVLANVIDKNNPIPLQRWLNLVVNSNRDVAALKGGDSSYDLEDRIIFTALNIKEPITQAYLDYLSGGGVHSLISEEDENLATMISNIKTKDRDDSPTYLTKNEIINNIRDLILIEFLEKQKDKSFKYGNFIYSIETSEGEKNLKRIKIRYNYNLKDETTKVAFEKANVAFENDTTNEEFKQKCEKAKADLAKIVGKIVIVDKTMEEKAKILLLAHIREEVEKLENRLKLMAPILAFYDLCRNAKTNESIIDYIEDLKLLLKRKGNLSFYKEYRNADLLPLVVEFNGDSPIIPIDKNILNSLKYSKDFESIVKDFINSTVNDELYKNKNYNNDLAKNVIDSYLSIKYNGISINNIRSMLADFIIKNVLKNEKYKNSEFYKKFMKNEAVEKSVKGGINVETKTFKTIREIIIDNLDILPKLDDEIEFEFNEDELHGLKEMKNTSEEEEEEGTISKDTYIKFMKVLLNDDYNNIYELYKEILKIDLDDEKIIKAIENTIVNYINYTTIDSNSFKKYSYKKDGEDKKEIFVKDDTEMKGKYYIIFTTKFERYIDDNNKGECILEGGAHKYITKNMTIFRNEEDENDGVVEVDLKRFLDIISNGSVERLIIGVKSVNTSGFINNGKTFEMKGGISRTHLKLLSNLINLNPVAYRPVDMLRDLYSKSYVSYTIYRHIYGIDESWKLNDCKKIFAATINYFHKDSLDVSQLFERMIYASTILGASSLRLSAERIRKAIDEMNVGNNNDNTRLIAKYITEFSPKLGEIAIQNFSLDGLNLDNVEIPDSFKAGEANNLGKGEIFEPKNLGLAPHANPNFVKAFIETSSGKETSILLKLDKNKNLAKLIPFTPAGTSILRIDYLCAYVDCLITLMHMTDYYDHESDTHLPFVTGTSEFNQFDVL